jgi:glycosyltransferase involved in cell wall biosynthesis
MDASPIFRSVKGGIGYYILNVLKHLAQIDHESEYVLYNTTGAKEGIPFPHQGNFRIVNTWRFTMNWHAEKDRIDVFHGPNYRLPARGRHGSVVTIYDLSVARMPQLFRKMIGRRRDFLKSKRIAKSADKIITTSEHSARDIKELYGIPRDKITVIYCGLSNEFYPETDPTLIQKIRQQYGLRDKNYLLFVGGADPRKNLITLLKAYALIKKIHSDYYLVITSGLDRDVKGLIELTKSLDIDKNVIFTGYVSQDALRVLYCQATLFVLPSLYEGFGMPILEAMACGTPVVASNTSCIQEVAGDAAVLVEPTDVNTLAASIRRILKDRETRESMWSKGFVRAKLFSWEKAARETLQVYKDTAVLNERIV